VTELSRQPFAGATEAIHRILNREAEADEVLRQSVRVLGERIPHYGSVGLYFVEEGELVLGPWAGDEPAERPQLSGDGTAGGLAGATGRRAVDIPVVYDGKQVAVIHVEAVSEDTVGPDDLRFLARIATLVSAHCLVGWDTGGVPWDAPG
jgi:putative methionine-R-sulfoxide reductase with GAF domain